MQMKAIEQYSPIVPFVMLVLLSFESVGENLNSDHSNESY